MSNQPTWDGVLKLIEVEFANASSTILKLETELARVTQQRDQLRVTVDMVHHCGLEHFPGIHSCSCKAAIEAALKL